MAAALGLGEVDVVGHPLGGMVASFYAMSRPTSRIVSIDGFPPGALSKRATGIAAPTAAGSSADVPSCYDITGPPECGDRSWKEAEVARLRLWMRSVGYTAPNAAAVVQRQFVPRGDGMFQRRPSRSLVEALFADASFEVLRAYRQSRADTLLIRCTGWAPPAIDVALENLARHRDNLELVSLAVSSDVPPAADACLANASGPALRGPQRSPAAAVCSVGISG